MGCSGNCSGRGRESKGPEFMGQKSKQRELSGFLAEFTNESDRATAVLGAAMLDECLNRLLTAFFVSDKAQVESLLDSERPLGTFGSRISAAYCMGPISTKEFETLRHIKSIRNAFAHELHGTSFTDDTITKKCQAIRELNLVNVEAPTDTPRDIFILSTVFLVASLNGSSTQVVHREIPCSPEEPGEVW